MSSRVNSTLPIARTHPSTSVIQPRDSGVLSRRNENARHVARTSIGGRSIPFRTASILASKGSAERMMFATHPACTLGCWTEWRTLLDERWREEMPRHEEQVPDDPF